MAFDLSKVKLRHVEKKRETGPVMGICNSDSDYKRLMEETYMEKYFDIIKPWTMESVFIPCPPAAIAAILALHKEYISTPDTCRSLFHWKSSSQTDHVHALALIEEQINQARSQLKSTGFFVRLSSRSPKDAALTSPQFTTLFTAALKRIEEAELSLPSNIAPSTDINRRLHAIYVASTAALRVHDGAAGIELLVESERIVGDLERALAEQSNREPFHIVLREFVDFDVQFEFRGFVYKKRLTALTQYNQYVYFPMLVCQRESIQETIVRFFEDQLAAALPLESYVVDFVLVQGSQRNKTGTDGQQFDVVIVEINPFAEFAGGGLFSWERDTALLMGQRAFEFRICERVPELAVHQISKTWAKYVFADQSSTSNCV